MFLFGVIFTIDEKLIISKGLDKLSCLRLGRRQLSKHLLAMTDLQSSFNLFKHNSSHNFDLSKLC